MEQYAFNLRTILATLLGTIPMETLKQGLINYLEKQYRVLEVLTPRKNNSVILKACVHTNCEQLVAVRLFHLSPLEWTANWSIAITKSLFPTVYLNHDNICKVHDIFDLGNNVYVVVMEYVEGEHLALRLDNEYQFGYLETLNILRSVGIALEHAHSMGLWYLQLSLNRIVVTPDGTVKLMDFGLTLNRPDVTVMPYFVAPECWDKEFDGRSDIYSLGLVGFALATRTIPFRDVNILNLRKAKQNTSLPQIALPRSVFSVGFEEWVLKCTEPNPEKRFQTMGEVVAELEKFILEIGST